MDKEAPSMMWHDLMLARRQFLEINLSSDCRRLVQFVNDAAGMHQALGFSCAEDMIREGYGLRPEEIKLTVEWLKLKQPQEPISLDAAIQLAKHGWPSTARKKLTKRPRRASRVNSGKAAVGAMTYSLSGQG